MVERAEELGVYIEDLDDFDDDFEDDGLDEDDDFDEDEY